MAIFNTNVELEFHVDDVGDVVLKCPKCGNDVLVNFENFKTDISQIIICEACQFSDSGLEFIPESEKNKITKPARDYAVNEINKITKKYFK